MFFWVHFSEQNLQVLAKTDEEVVEGFSGLLYAAAERASLHGLVDVALHVTLNCRDDLYHVASLVITEAKVLDDCHSFAVSRERQTVSARTCLAAPCVPRPERLR